MQFHARPPSFLVLIQRELFLHDELTGGIVPPPSGQDPKHLSCRRLFERRQIIPAPVSGLSVLSEIVQPFLSLVLKIEEIFSVFCCSKRISATVVGRFLPCEIRETINECRN